MSTDNAGNQKPVTSWYYYDSSGQKQGAITSGQLKRLAETGQITPGTMIETESGKTAPAAKIKGLTFAETIQPTVSQSVPTPKTETGKNLHWIILASLVALLVIGGIGWVITKNTPSISNQMANDLVIDQEHVHAIKAIEPAANAKNDTQFSAIEQAEIDKFVAEHGNDVRTIDEKGETLLHKAVEQGSVVIVKYLVSRGANVNAKASNGWTALQRAALGGNLEIAEFLVAKGADVDTKDNNDWTPFRRSVSSEHLELARFFLSQGANVNTRDNFQGWTPLHVAALDEEKLEIVKFLVVEGADVNAKNHDGETPIYWTCRHETPAIAQFLVSQGADVNVRNKSGDTPLHRALMLNKLEVIRILVPAGANINARNNAGLSPLDYARGSSNSAIRAYFARWLEGRPVVN